MQLGGWFQQALTGQRQLVFVTGEAGIGKTTLVDAFVERLREQKGAWIGRGQCIEHYGAGEAYMPVLEALGRLCRQPDGQRLIELLDQYAPTWLVQMPTLLSPDKLAALKQKVVGVTPERMLREMAEAVEAFTAEQVLILVLEDLHWSDYATLELLAMLARRREAARLLMIGTYRPVEMLVHEHPLRGVKQELQLHGHCRELALEFLTEQAVQEYLANRWNGKADESASLQDLTRFIHNHTDRNPLFMVNMVDYLIRQGVVAETAGSWELRGRLDAAGAGRYASFGLRYAALPLSWSAGRGIRERRTGSGGMCTTE
jgi:predicted ATPase